MSAPHLHDRQDARAAAAWWLNERRSGDMTADDAAAFEAWIGADPANREAYQALERRYDGMCVQENRVGAFTA